MTNVGYHIRNGWLQKPPLGVQLNRAHPLTKGLVGCWMFNEGGGDKAYDLSGYNNHGTLENMAFPSTAASGWNPGRKGGALSFDGSNDYVNCGNDPSLNITAAITMEEWVKPDAMQAKDIYSWRGDNYKHSRNLYLKSDGTIHYELHTDAIAVIRIISNAVYSANEWMHVVVTDDCSATRMYINSILQTDVESTGCGLLTVSSQITTIGRHRAGGYFCGSMDGVNVYNRALSAPEIQQLYYDPYCIFEPATKYTIIDERLRTKHVGSNVAAMQMLRGRTVI